MIPWQRWPRPPSVLRACRLWIAMRESDSIMTWDSSNSLASGTPSCSAINSISRLVYCPGSILLGAATASPLQFLITTPMLDLLPSSDEAPSTFVLWKSDGGAIHLDPSGACFPLSEAIASLCSEIILFAWYQTWLGEWSLSSKHFWFLLYQMDQAATTKSSKSQVAPSLRILIVASEKSMQLSSNFTGQSSHIFQTCLTELHSSRECAIDSAS